MDAGTHRTQAWPPDRAGDAAGGSSGLAGSTVQLWSPTVFLALRDLRFARGRFALMGTVIALISLLVVLLSGLTAGLAAESVSAIRSLPADHLAFAAPPAGEKASFSASRLDDRRLSALADAPGVRAATPLGVARATADVAGRTSAVTAFGVDPAGFLSPLEAAPDNALVASPAWLAEQHLAVGDTVRIDGTPMRVAGSRADSSFNHTPVVWLSLAQWQRLDAAAGAATVAALRTGPGFDPAATEGATILTRDGALAAVGSYSAENGSLTLMRVLLLVVGALVVGAFFTVWTIQRTPDLAVLKAIGASTGYLVRDAASQALAVLVLGGAVGTGIAVAAGTVASRTVPFVITPATTAVPLALLLAVGMVGALAAVRRIATVDPLTALGVAR
jgi:putative ABC transport system permease protein